MSRTAPLVLSMVCLCAAVGASSSIQGEAPSPQTGDPSPTPLRELSRIRFSEDKWFAWMQPAQCDDSGNVFVVPVPKADTRIDPSLAKGPSAILRISKDGKSGAVLDPAGLSVFSEATDVSMVAIAVDSTGTSFALLWVPRDETGSFYIVSYDKRGQYRSRVEVDPNEMLVGAFEVFGSGAFLLQGVRRLPEGEPRLAIMPEKGGSWRDVLGVFSDPSLDPTTPKRPAHMARAGDGLIYCVLEGEDSVYVIRPSAESREAFALPPVPRNRRLAGLKAAGSRLALIYFEDRPLGNWSGRFWIDVYETGLGDRVGAYGPIMGPPLCFQQKGGQDRFTLLDAGCVVTMGP